MTTPIMSSCLDEFPIRTSQDYSNLDQNKRFEFQRRLPIIAKNEKKRVLPELEEYIGLKMHFHVTRDPELGWINLPNETFAKKLSFFAGKIIITFPFHEVSYREHDDVQALLKVVCIPRVFIDNDIVNIFPSAEDGFSINIERFNKDYGLISANFNLRQLERQFEENVINIQNIYLPVFQDIEPMQIIDIRKKEAVLYLGLENRLARLFNWFDHQFTEVQLLDEMVQIDNHVRHLAAAFEAIDNACKTKDKDMILSFVKVGLVLLLPGSKELAATFGKKFANRTTQMASQVKATLDENAIEYYLFWRIHHLNK
ncbi:MAG: hypothetical protein PHU14_12475 [Methylovulum sp.]|nr:hypothetical protein [Methylovulum sp.]